MGAMRDISISVAGATIVGLAVFGVDKYLATKQAASSAAKTPDLGANGFIEAQEIGAQFMGGTNNNLAGTPGNIAAPPPGSTTTITTNPDGTTTTSTTATASGTAQVSQPTQTAAQASIAASLAALSKLSANAGNVNVPATHQVNLP